MFIVLFLVCHCTYKIINIRATILHVKDWGHNENSEACSTGRNENDFEQIKFERR